MNKKLILVLVLALAVANAQNLAFNLQGIQFNRASDYWSVAVPVSGSSSPNNVAYACELPSGWRLENNIFRIPSAHAANYNQEYICRCKVRDNSLNTAIERALSFRCTQTGFVVSDFDYFYGQTSYSNGPVGTYTGLDVLQRLQSLGGSILGGSTQINGGLSVLGNLGASVGGVISTGLPSWSECDKLIKDGNIAEILALINKVVSSTTIKCQAKTAFLNDLLGRICAAIEIKKENVLQINALIAKVRASVLSLQQQAERLKDEQSKINIDGLKASYEQLLIKVKAAYDSYNQCLLKTGNKTKQLQSYKQQLKELENYIYQLQCDLGDCQAKLKKYDDSIAALEAQLVQLKKERAQVKIQCDKISANIQIYIDKRTELNQKIQAILAQIDRINQQCSGLKTAYEQIELQLRTLKAKIEQAEYRFHEINERLTQINIEIERLRAQISQYQLKLKALNQCIESLNSAIKEIKSSITFVHYNCNNCQNVVIDDNDNEPCFKFGRNDWFSYMNKCYGIQPTQIQIAFPQVTVQIKSINIFSNIFQQTYGSCFGDQIKNRGQQGDDQSYGFDNDFQCAPTVDALAVKKGKIRAINNKYIDVDCDDGQQVRLRLGSCSRLEGPGRDFVPRVGHNITFKGVKNADASFNLHHCTCF